MLAANLSMDEEEAVQAELLELQQEAVRCVTSPSFVEFSLLSVTGKWDKGASICPTNSTRIYSGR
jgi:hypothetical protein